MCVAADIFEKAGFGAGKDATGVSVLLGFFKLVMTGGPSMIPYLGRKRASQMHALALNCESQLFRTYYVTYTFAGLANHLIYILNNTVYIIAPSA